MFNFTAYLLTQHPRSQGKYSQGRSRGRVRFCDDNTRNANAPLDVNFHL
jgi:hypothetical protein